MSTNPPKGKLISHFENRSPEDHGSGWSDLWDTGSDDLWDRGMPSPALIDLIEQQQSKPDSLFDPFTADGRRKRALVPGCGRGYDVVMLALHGFDAYGLEISAKAVSEAEAYAASEMKQPRAQNFGAEYESGSAGVSAGSATFLQGDFFKSNGAGEETYDLIYDYTFLCALHPSMRKNWATRMAELLSPGGLLVCLEFPMYKDLKLSGPPWGLKGVHWDLLARGGDGLLTSEIEENETDTRGWFTRTLYLKPARTYEMGKGTDMLSVYTRK